jgi:hypothetical protein
MRKHMNLPRNAGQWLLVLLIISSLVATTGVSWAAVLGSRGQLAVLQPWELSPALGSDGQPQAYSPGNASIDPAPSQLAETLTSRPFWIVLGLVVLGSLVLMADFRETD